jgi:flagellar hook-associated protein 2
MASTISGLSSGLDWQDIVTQIREVEKAPIDLLEERITKYEEKLTAWQDVNSRLLSLKSSAQVINNISAFDLFTASTNSSSSTSADNLLTASVGADGTAGSYSVQISQLAQAQKLSSASFTSKTTALGYSGDILINGQVVNIVATDDLQTVRDKINAQNTGSNASGVAAAILQNTTTDFRLILTSHAEGADGISLLDANTSDALQSLGLTSSDKTIKNTTSDGFKSDSFTSSTTAIGTLLGLTSAPTSTSVTIGGNSVDIDLSTESLTTIAGNINALTGISASVISSTTDGVTTYQIDISGTTSYSDSNNVLETLGFIKGTHTSTTEVHAGSLANTDGDASTLMTDGVGGTDMVNIWTNGASAGVTVGDTIAISGTQGDGTVLEPITYTAQIGDKVQDLLDRINNTTDGFGSGSRTAAASVVDGKIVITDSESGDSQLSLSLIANNENGGTLDIGDITATTEGRDMEVVAGQDAQFTVDGIALTNSSNTVSSIIEGVTLNLVSAETGTTITVSIDRDLESVKAKIQAFVDDYNDITSFIREQLKYDEEKEETGGVLFGDQTLVSIQSDIRNIVVNSIWGADADLNTLGLIGINLDNEGILSIDDSKMTSYLNTNFEDVRNIFTATGFSDNSNIKFIGGSKDTQKGEYAVNITTVASKGIEAGSVDLSGSGIGGNNTITLTEGGRTAAIALSAGNDIDTIVNSINSEVVTQYAEARKSTSTNTASGSAITNNTAWSAMDGVTAEDGDMITFGGTTRSGVAVSGSYTIDLANDDVGDLLSAIEDGFDNSIYATVDTDGRIVVSEKSVGDSNLTFTINTSDVTGLTIGTFDSAALNTEGRYQLNVTASKSVGNELVLSHNSYGSGYSFTVSQTDAAQTGITDNTYTGTDVAGTINSEAATGQGQVLTGNSGESNVDGLSIQYTGFTTGAIGDIKLTQGVAEQMNTKLYYITDSNDGYLGFKLDTIHDNIDGIEDNIDFKSNLLDKRMEILTKKFISMEIFLKTMSSLSSWLDGQINSLS